MSIRVLHIWGPGFKNSFGGQYIYWKQTYEKWNNRNIIHSILDYDEYVIKPVKELINERTNIKKKYPNRFQRLLWGIKLLWFIASNRHCYDVLHVHILLWGGLLTAPWAKIIGKTAIYESVLEGADNPSSIKKEKLGMFMFWCQSKFDNVVAISSALANDFKLHNIPVENISNSVDSSIFSPAKSPFEIATFRRENGISSDSNVLLFVGSLKERKGADILIHMFVSLAKNDSNLMLIIVGPKSVSESESIDSEFVNNMYLILESRNLLERVKFIGMVEEKNVLARFYQISDIFVFPTRQEGLGNVILEAAACQLPIVVTHLPEIEDIIDDRVTGLFVAAEDVEGLGNAVKHLLQNKSFANKIAHNARIHVKKNFSFSVWQRKMSNLYEKLLLPADNK